MIRADQGLLPLGKIAAARRSRALLSDELVNQIVASRLQQQDCARGFRLMYYPRSLEQARFVRVARQPQVPAADGRPH